ncbi:FkbM family methyltransferase [Candidatus Pelagibacter sp.]|jgi:FkbM family methyltransferase|nr:FkbM family methyltransferase [Candidatus Pelagibacter sp.]|tara:strand:+ start:82 stop:780 length:699 start_codon:yes stop_codon:yes gene_type:complete
MIKSLILFCLKIIRYYWHEPNILKSLKKLNINYIFDVGSHRGESIDYFIKLKNLKKIQSFEPQKDIFLVLKKKYINNNKVILNQIALSQNENYKDFYINDLSSTSTFSRLNKKSLWLKIKNKILNKKNPIINKIKIRSLTIDKFIKQKKIKKIDLLKIDTEGHELEVLKGALKTIKEHKVKFILIELHFSKMYQNYSKKKIESFLAKNNFFLLKKFKFPFLSFVDNLYKFEK